MFSVLLELAISCKLSSTKLIQWNPLQSLPLQVNFVTCMFLSIPFAVIYNRYLGEASVQTRKIYPLVIGLAYCWFCFGEYVQLLIYLTFF